MTEVGPHSEMNHYVDGLVRKIEVGGFLFVCFFGGGWGCLFVCYQLPSH